jgi:ribosomal protein S24E
MTLEKYLAAKLIIKVNEKLISGKLQDMNVAEKEIGMNVEYSGGGKPKTINVINLIMTSLYSDMSNMVIVRVNNFEEGMKLTSDITQQIFNIK